MNIFDLGKVRESIKSVWNNKRSRAITIICGCCVVAVSVSAFAFNRDTIREKGKAVSDAVSSIPITVEKINIPVSSPSSDSSTANAASVASSVSSDSSSDHSSAEKTSRESSSAKDAASASSQTQKTHYVRVETVLPSSSSSTHASSSSPSGHIKNYQGTDESKTYTDSIAGSPETVQFLGVGAGYQEVAIAEIQFQTSAALGAAHYGIGKATLTGPVSHTSNAMVGTAGTCSLFTVGNLTAGTYDAKLTAHDGTVVADFHITVDSGGIVR